jgi:hypothetical protein
MTRRVLPFFEKPGDYVVRDNEVLDITGWAELLGCTATNVFLFFLTMGFMAFLRTFPYTI